MTKKFLSLLLSLAFVTSSAVAFTGCGDSSSSSSSPTQSDTQTDTGSDNDSELNDSDIFGTEESEGLAYTLSKDESHYMVAGMGECTDTKVVVPATYNNRPVLGIAEGNSQAGAGAFEGHPTLESIVLPEGATTIGAAAFASCRKLVRISVPDSITMIEETAFKGCSALKYNEYENGKYLGNQTNPYAALASAKSETITSVSVHEDTKLIMKNAFVKCTALTSASFEVTEGWTIDGTAITATDLASPATAADYLKNTYSARIWLRK